MLILRIVVFMNYDKVVLDENFSFDETINVS